MGDLGILAPFSTEEKKISLLLLPVTPSLIIPISLQHFPHLHFETVSLIILPLLQTRSPRLCGIL